MRSCLQSMCCGGGRISLGGFLHRRIRVRLDYDINVRSGFQSRFFAVVVGDFVFNADFSVEVFGFRDFDLSLLRLIRKSRLDYPCDFAVQLLPLLRRAISSDVGNESGQSQVGTSWRGRYSSRPFPSLPVNAIPQLLLFLRQIESNR